MARYLATVTHDGTPVAHGHPQATQTTARDHAVATLLAKIVREETVLLEHPRGTYDNTPSDTRVGCAVGGDPTELEGLYEWAYYDSDWFADTGLACIVAPIPDNPQVAWVADQTADTDKHFTSALAKATHLAESLAAQAAEGLTRLGVLASTTDLLDRATHVSNTVTRALADSPQGVPAGDREAVARLGERLAAAAESVDRSAPGDSAVRAAHQGVAAMFRLAAEVVRLASR